MPFSEEELHRRLQQGTSPAGEEEADALWAAIAGDLPVAAASNSAAAGGFRWWLLLGGVLLLVPTLMIFAPSEAKDQSITLSPAEHLPNTAAVVAPATLSSKRSTTNNESITEPTASVRPVTPEPNAVTPLNTSLTEGSTPALHPRPRPVQPIANQPTGQARLASTTLLPTIDVAPLTTTQSINPPDIVVEATAEPFERVSKLILGGDAGANVLWERHESNSESAPNEGLESGLKTALGQQARITLGYRLGNGFTAHTGLGYTRTHTVLDYNIEYDTLAPHPSFPNQTTAGLARYSVAHNNRLSWVSLPLGLSYERAVGRVAIGLGVGTSLNYQLNASGKLPTSRSNSETFSGTAETDRLHLSYYLAPELSCALTGDASLRFYLRGRAERLNFGTSSVTGLTRRGWLLGGSLGLRKDL